MKFTSYQKYLIPTLLSAFTVFCFGATGEICGPLFETTADAFEAKFPENDADDLKKVTGKLSAEKSYQFSNSTGNPLVYFTVTNPTSGIVAYDLKAQKIAWQIQIPVNSPLVLKHNTLILQTGLAVAAYRADNGTMLWSVPIDAGWSYYGADLTAGVVVLSFGIGSGNTGGYANGRLVAVQLKDGKEIWQNLTGNGLLGTPAVTDKFVFVPWKKKQIAIIKLNTGEEISRLRADDFTVNFVQSTPYGVFYGTNATDDHLATLFKLDQHAVKGTRLQSNSFVPGTVAAPNYPGFHRDSFVLPSIDIVNSNRIRYYWLPEENDARIRFTDDTYYLHYWRYIFAFSAKTHQVKWTYMSDDDIHTLQPVKGGLFAVTIEGTVIYADADKGYVPSWNVATGLQPSSILLDVHGFLPISSTEGALPDPRAQLKVLVADKDNRMLPARMYATELLANIPTPGITADLLALHSDASMPTALQKKIVEKLAERDSGADALIQSLNVRYDYLEEIATPPMKVIAPALANMDARDALPGLMQQLLDYETPTTNMEAIAAAVLKLGNATVVEPLQNFIVLYHADTSFVGNEDALARICQAILKFGDEQSKKDIEKIRDNEQTLPELRKQLLTILDPDADKKAMELAIKKAQEAEVARQRAMELRKAQELASRPYFLTRDVISATISKNAYLLRPCIKSALEKRLGLRQVRMKFSISGATGISAGLSILPPDIPGLEECLADGLSKIKFPKFKNVRQNASHTIRITGVRRKKPDSE